MFLSSCASDRELVYLCPLHIFANKHVCVKLSWSASYFLLSLMFVCVFPCCWYGIQLEGKAELIGKHVIGSEQKNSFCILPFLFCFPNSKQHLFLCQVPVCVQDRICSVREPRPAGGLPVRLPAGTQHCSPHLHPQPVDPFLHLHRTGGVRPRFF